MVAACVRLGVGCHFVTEGPAPGVGGGASGAAASRCPTARGRGPEPGFPVNSELRSLQDREVHPRPTRASHVIEVFQNVRGCSTCRLVSPRALADPRVCVWSALARGPRRYRCHHRKHLVTRTFGSEGYSQRSCPHAHSDTVCRRSEQRTGEEQRCLWMQETTARTPTLSGEGQGTVGRGQLGGKSGCGGRGGLPSPPLGSAASCTMALLGRHVVPMGQSHCRHPGCRLRGEPLPRSQQRIWGLWSLQRVSFVLCALVIGNRAGETRHSWEHL